MEGIDLYYKLSEWTNLSRSNKIKKYNVHSSIHGVLSMDLNSLQQVQTPVRGLGGIRKNKARDSDPDVACCDGYDLPAFQSHQQYQSSVGCKYGDALGLRLTL